MSKKSKERMNLIDKKGKELKLKEDTIKKAKDFAMQYFEKTYKSPIADACDISIATIYKWYTDIANTIDIDINI